eukprot:CAMPEP_0117421664 /NCGR_PEP_ID=MMETSP0758-20121206/2690_1 /TAXON_ID=63605 /ORGANISM="Percolomonas cosmopolitus, Strain AE-1 (ATCC 50343)" /LENGTH=597 /DNA_ID=CAMNT_0005203883 /DNA_START=287 /DNA_END=2081 /DNA_ORIENTATION=+
MVAQIQEDCQAYINDQFETWIGLEDQEGVDGPYIWSDNTTTNYTNWGVNEPKDTGIEGCVSLTKNGTMKTENCTKTKKAYVCLVDAINLCGSGGNTPECECHAGYEGETCQQATCHGIRANETNVCNGQGECVYRDECRNCNQTYTAEDPQKQCVAKRNRWHAVGLNEHGELGITHNETQPNYIELNTTMFTDDIKDIKGGLHTLVLLQSGSVYAAGLNDAGQLGDVNRETNMTFAQIQGLENIVAISANERTSHALTENAIVLSWGNNQNGECGINSMVDSITTLEETLQTNVESGERITQVHASTSANIMISHNGSAYFWGLFPGQIQVDVPERVNMTIGILMATCGEHVCLFYTQNNSLWGIGEREPLGVSSGSDYTFEAPHQIEGMPTNDSITSMACGISDCLVVTSEGYLIGMGENGMQQLTADYIGHAPQQIAAFVAHVFSGRGWTLQLHNETGLAYVVGLEPYNATALALSNFTLVNETGLLEINVLDDFIQRKRTHLQSIECVVLFMQVNPMYVHHMDPVWIIMYVHVKQAMKVIIVKHFIVLDKIIRISKSVQIMESVWHQILVNVIHSMKGHNVKVDLYESIAMDWL